MNWRLLILSTVLVSILVFLHFKETLYLALFWFWSSGVTATVMLVYQICSTPRGQLVPLALLLTVVMVRFRLFLFLQVVMLSNPPSYTLLAMRAGRSQEILNSCCRVFLDQKLPLGGNQVCHAV